MSRCVMCIACYAPRMLQRSVGLLVMGLVLPGAAEPAQTCIFMPALPHHVDATLQRSDASAPLALLPPCFARARTQFRRRRPVRRRRLSAMIRLHIPSVDAAVIHGEWAR